MFGADSVSWVGMGSYQLDVHTTIPLKREIIVGKIRGNCGTEIAKQQCEWIKEWIADPETTEEEVRGLLLFWTGSESVEGLTELSVLEGESLYPGTTHFFAKCLHVADREIEDGEFNNTTKEGYYKVLGRVSEGKELPNSGLVRGSIAETFDKALAPEDGQFSGQGPNAPRDNQGPDGICLIL